MSSVTLLSWLYDCLSAQRCCQGRGMHFIADTPIVILCLQTWTETMSRLWCTYANWLQSGGRLFTEIVSWTSCATGLSHSHFLPFSFISWSSPNPLCIGVWEASPTWNAFHVVILLSSNSPDFSMFLLSVLCTLLLFVRSFIYHTPHYFTSFDKTLSISSSVVRGMFDTRLCWSHVLWFRLLLSRSTHSCPAHHCPFLHCLSLHCPSLHCPFLARHCPVHSVSRNLPSCLSHTFYLVDCHAADRIGSSL